MTVKGSVTQHSDLLKVRIEKRMNARKKDSKSKFYQLPPKTL